MSAYSVWRSISDGSVISDIPDSVSNRWPHNEGSGTTLGDSIGSINGSINGPSWVTGSGGEGSAYLDYDGVDDETDFSNNASHFDHDTQSWMLWVNPDDITTNRAYIRYNDSAEDLLIWNRGDTANGRLECFMDDADGGSDLETGADGVLSSGVWNFVTVVLDNMNQVAVYHAVASDTDVGAPISTQNYDQGLDSTISSVAFGLRDDGTDGHDGGMDDVLFCQGSAIPESDIEEWFDSTKQSYV